MQQHIRLAGSCGYDVIFFDVRCAHGSSRKDGLKKAYRPNRSDVGKRMSAVQFLFGYAISEGG